MRKYSDSGIFKLEMRPVYLYYSQRNDHHHDHCDHCNTRCHLLSRPLGLLVNRHPGCVCAEEKFIRNIKKYIYSVLTYRRSKVNVPLVLGMYDLCQVCF